MAHPARPPARHPPNPSLARTPRPAPPPSPTTPAARRPETPRRAAQDTPWATCVDGSRNSTSSQCKQNPRINQIRHANEATSSTKGIVEPDYSDKLKVPRFSGGTYSKPEARVKLIPMEDITYAKHKKPYGRTVGSAVLQKRHCRRSVTPPPNSRKVSLVGSKSLTQSSMTSASSYDSCLPRKRLETAETRHPFTRGHISSSVTPQITSLKDPASPSCKSSQPLSTNWNTDATPRNLDRMDGTKALARSSNSSILHSQGQSSQKLSEMVNHVYPSPKQMRAPHPSGDPVCTKAGPSSKSLCTPESGKLCSRNINLTTRSTAAPGLQASIAEPALLSPTYVLSERPIEVYPDTRAAAPVVQEPSVKPVLPSPITVHNESSTECDNTPPMHSTQSIASAQHGALLQERNSGASINCSRSSAFCHNVGTPETGARVILHTKLHKKHDQPEALWKGNFHVTGELIHTCDGLEAHFPLEICVRVYEASKNMPEILNLEAIPLSQLWPKQFKMEPPDGGDIGLWFLNSHERPHRSFDHLLEKVSSHTGLLTKVGDTELAIFSSLLLSPNYQRKNGELYFWGVFGKRIRKKGCQPSNHIKNVNISNPSQSNEDSCNKYEEVGARLNVTKGKGTENNESDIGMTLGARGNSTDVTENKERVRDNYEGMTKLLDLTGGRVNDCMADSNPASSCSALATSLLNGSCSHDSASKSTFSLEDSACQPAYRSSASSDLMLDIPPGFSLDVSPGFTKAHCRLPIEAAGVSGADAPPSLILDTPGFPKDIPPGFTEAHRRLPAGPATHASTPGTEIKPIVRLSLNVTRPVKIEVPPGFANSL